MVYIKEKKSPKKGICFKILVIITALIILLTPMAMFLNVNSLRYNKDNLLISCTTKHNEKDIMDLKISKIAEQKVHEQKNNGEIIDWRFDKERFVNSLRTTTIVKDINADLEQKIKNCITINFNQYELKIGDNNTTFYFKSEKEANDYRDKIKATTEIAKVTVQEVKVTSQADLDKKYAEITKPIAVANTNKRTTQITSRAGTFSRAEAKGILPISNYVYISSGYRTSHRPNHTGTDFAANYGTNILAWKSGTVTRASWNGGYGKCIEVSHGNGFSTRYAHCSSFNVSVGQVVLQGQVIGFVGSTGNSTGNHLHFEVMINGVFQSPLSYIQ